MSDKWTRIFLALIALALWINLVQSVWAPQSVAASVQDEAILARIESMLVNMDENLEVIALGSCMNSQLC